MKQVLPKLQHVLQHCLAFIPSKLPQGVTEFEAWSKHIINLYQMPDNDSIRFALAAGIMHLPSTAAYRPKRYFGTTLIKGAANQVAHQIIQDLKDKQKKEEQAAALEKSKASAEVVQ